MIGKVTPYEDLQYLISGKYGQHQLMKYDTNGDKLWYQKERCQFHHA